MRNIRKNYITKPIFKWAQSVLPSMSETEREALEAGDIWWDADLFTGNPDWDKLLAVKPASLSKEEQEFLDGPTQELCNMLDEWVINRDLKDLPQDVWDFIRKNKFFAMIIPKKYGGLEFSAFANSQVVRKIASRSVVAAVTVMVPNSLGPGELLMHFGTQKQRDDWLPRLAGGEEIPCFGLTSPEAGSDAGAMIDKGIICKGRWNGEEVTGIRLNWHKRYITLGPVATVLGLAFKLYDPDHILGDEEDLGITVALVPTDLEGIDIGRRHLPAYQMFQNGPNWGRDVFIPFDYIIGGQDNIGKGWKMLMAALAAGRGISLPSLSAAATSFCAYTTGAYARIRHQFHIPIGKFEGVQERMGQMAANAYLLDAARYLTCAGLDAGHEPSVISAIMKTHATYKMRESVNDAMDIHAGKAIIDGPMNYLGDLYRSVPVGITVEGANILTRNLIIFGQGSIRCHPYILKEMMALEERDQDKALSDFDQYFWAHVGHSIVTLGRAWVRCWSNALIAPAPSSVSGKVRPYYKSLSRYAAAFALLADAAFLTMGGALKRKEMISARLGDILSELYFLSAVLKRWEDDGRPEADLPLVEFCMMQGFTNIEESYNGVLKNLPNRPMAWITRFFIQPFGPRKLGLTDKIVQQCAEILMEPSETRARLSSGLHYGHGDDAVCVLDQAFKAVIDIKALRDKMRGAKISDVDEALKQSIITQSEADRIKRSDELSRKVIAVDDFTDDELKGRSINAKPERKKDAA